MYFCTTCETEAMHRDPIPERGTAICKVCGTENKLPWRPLFVITGGGGCGKTTVAQGLLRKPNPYFVLQADYFGAVEKAFDSWDDFWAYMTLLSCQFTKNLKSVVLCGWVNPSQVEQAPCAAYFSAVHYLVISCDATTQAARLKGRHPRGRPSPPTPQDIDMCVKATRIITKEARSLSRGTVLETTHLTRNQVVSAADRWILERLDG